MSITILVNGILNNMNDEKELSPQVAQVITKVYQNKNLRLSEYSLNLHEIPGGFLNPLPNVDPTFTLRIVPKTNWNTVLELMKKSRTSFWEQKGSRVYALDFLGDEDLLELYHALELPYAYVGKESSAVEGMMVAQEPLAIYAPGHNTLAPLRQLHQACKNALLYQGPLPALKNSKKSDLKQE
ncbi:hypothetical protein D6774_04865 [Candidatus Woesearchaeota archaeon]|jgi:hypothetical protein|nr:MAG: hypothetical protein D6774_04865 [Candidatus Woesearchaeota archaeon]